MEVMGRGRLKRGRGKGVKGLEYSQQQPSHKNQMAREEARRKKEREV